MKKRILILIIILLLTTGCTCEYNLTIEGNNYKEEIIIIGDNEEEISTLNNEWKIPVDKEEYEMLIGLDGTGTPEGDIYQYNLSNNKLTFNHNFTKNNYIQSTAASKCFSKIKIIDYENELIISSGLKLICFDENPNLTNVKINIKVDQPVVEHDADNVNGNIYTWNLNKDNSNNKTIKLVLENNTISQDSQTEIPNNQEQNKRTGKYDLYIFLLILLLVAFIGYKFIMKFKDRNNNID